MEVDLQSVDSDEYEEEECLVYVDFETKFLEDQLKDPNLKMQLIGVNTENPILQVNSKLFKGSYDYAMGTNVFFNESPHSPEPDPNYRDVPEKMFQYFGKTNKVLKMKRIFVEERDKNGEDIGEGEHSESLDNFRVTKTYGEALNQFLQPGEQPPREIEDDEIPVEGEPMSEQKTSKADTGSQEMESTGQLDDSFGMDADTRAELDLERMLTDPDYMPS